MNKSVKHIDLHPNKTAAAFSLMELLVVVGIIAILVGLSMPAINAMQKSYNSTGTESMISAALATARTLAISNHKYAGVRFQKAYNRKGPQIDAEQYMIFITDDENKSGLTCGFIAIEGYKPMKLPSNIGVIDKMVRTFHSANPRDCGQVSEGQLASSDLDDSGTNLDPNNNNRNITDISTFSIVFSSTGKLVSHEIRCRNNDQANRTDNSSDDDVFNTKYNVSRSRPIGMFIQDDFDDYGIGIEYSRREIFIYDREKFKTMKTANQRWTYLSGLATIYINAYTGEIIKN